jgi:hypothetical protein
MSYLVVLNGTPQTIQAGTNGGAIVPQSTPVDVNGLPYTAAYGQPTQPVMADYAAMALTGKIFHAASGAVTIASTHVSPLAAGTGTPILALYNPPASPVNAVLLKHGVQTISGQPGGPILWNYAIGTTITGLASGTSTPALLGGSPAACSIFTNSATTGSLVGVPLKAAWNIQAGWTGFAETVAMEEDAGDIVIPPGAYLALAAYALGSTHVLMASMTWAEITAGII